MTWHCNLTSCCWLCFSTNASTSKNLSLKIPRENDHPYSVFAQDLSHEQGRNVVDTGKKRLEMLENLLSRKSAVKGCFRRVFAILKSWSQQTSELMMKRKISAIMGKTFFLFSFHKLFFLIYFLLIHFLYLWSKLKQFSANNSKDILERSFFSCKKPSKIP